MDGHDLSASAGVVRFFSIVRLRGMLLASQVFQVIVVKVQVLSTYEYWTCETTSSAVAAREKAVKLAESLQLQDVVDRNRNLIGFYRSGKGAHGDVPKSQ